MKPNLPRNEESEREKMEKLPSISIERENEGRAGSMFTVREREDVRVSGEDRPRVFRREIM